jgi:iron complex outermembrane recepter protein
VKTSTIDNSAANIHAAPLKKPSTWSKSCNTAAQLSGPHCRALKMQLHSGSSRRWIVALACTIGSANVRAQSPPGVPPADLYQISLESLMNMEVTSVSKREQKMSQTAAAIFVINQDDIQRSGALNIPDLLRIVPGLDVAQINANTWAISSRGFNYQFSNKLLVLIDGRTVFTPSQDGVNWDTQDVPLEDIERIEVIRGPGATVWGANAVNGVINVITKSAMDTQGGLLTGGSGTENHVFGTIQNGGTLAGDVSYRLFAKYLDADALTPVTGSGSDAWHLLHGGFRLDGHLFNADLMTLQGDIYSGTEGEVIGHIASFSPPDNENVERSTSLEGGNLLGRWVHVHAGAGESALQVYFDRYLRLGGQLDETCNTIDIDFHQDMRVGLHHRLVWGLGYRHEADRTVGTIDQAFDPVDANLQQFSAFVQDEITLRPERLTLTVGSKLEHNDFTGFEIEPSARAAFTPNARETIWAAVSDSARTPSLRDDNADFNLGIFSLPDGSPAITTIEGNPQQKSEYLLSEELGYRLQVNAQLSIDLSLFHNRYRNLRSFEQGAPLLQSNPQPYTEIPIYQGNRVNGTTDGLELSTKLRITDQWTLSPGYALLRMDLHNDPGSVDMTTVADVEGSSPRNQAQLRSALDISRVLSWNVAAYFVDRLPAQQVSSYTRLDTELSWQPQPALALRLVGQNLLRDRHVESIDIQTSVNSSQLQRSVYAKISWKF